MKLYKLNLEENMILNFGGAGVAMLGGILGNAVAKIPYPLDLLLWLPGWSMMLIAFLDAALANREQTKHD